jgi:two-component system response regulator YesN
MIEFISRISKQQTVRFMELLKQEMGCTITDYLIQVRIQKAKQFMDDHPNLKIYEIANLVGYPDPVYFNKLFKKVVQATPKEYKDRSRLKGLSGS